MVGEWSAQDDVCGRVARGQLTQAVVQVSYIEEGFAARHQGILEGQYRALGPGANRPDLGSNEYAAS